MNKRNNDGITLIALVVTIIVLLILAGVTISTLTGDNGLIQKAGESKKTTEKAREEEMVKLAVDYILKTGDRIIIKTDARKKEPLNNLEEKAFTTHAKKKIKSKNLRYVK